MDLSNLNKPVLLATPSEGVDLDRTLPDQERERPETIEVGSKTVEEEEEVDALEISEISPYSSADLQKEMMQLQQRMTVLQTALNNRNSRERVTKNSGRSDQSFVSRPETADNQGPFHSPMPSWFERAGKEPQQLRESVSTPLPDSLGGLVFHPADSLYASAAFLQPGHDPISSTLGRSYTEDEEEEINIARTLVALGQALRGGRTRQETLCCT